MYDDSCVQDVRRMAGVVVLLGVGLSVVIDRRFLVLAAFAGANLLVSTFTGVCPAERLSPNCSD